MIRSLDSNSLAGEIGTIRFYHPDQYGHSECYRVEHKTTNLRKSVRYWPLKVYNMVDRVTTMKKRDDRNNPQSPYAMLYKGGTVRVDTFRGVVEIQKNHPRFEEVLWDFGSLDTSNVVRLLD